MSNTNTDFSNFTYWGCWADNTQNNWEWGNFKGLSGVEIGDNVYVNSGKLLGAVTAGDMSSCITLAQNNNFNTAGLELGVNCYGGTSSAGTYAWGGDLSSVPKPWSPVNTPYSNKAASGAQLWMRSGPVKTNNACYLNYQAKGIYGQDGQNAPQIIYGSNLATSGFTCNLGKGIIPTYVDSNSDITYPTYPAIIDINNPYASQSDCNAALTMPGPAIAKSGITCSVGDTSSTCQTLYNNLDITLSKQGLSCKYGNGTVPTSVNSNEDIIYPTSTIINTSKNSITDCTNNLKIYSATATCDNGSTTADCKQLNENLGLKTFGQLGYDLVTSENGKITTSTLPIYGKHTDTTFSCASYDGSTCITANTIDFKPIGGTDKVQDLTCNTITDKPASNVPTMCEQAFVYYGLYPSTNPLVIHGHNLNQTTKTLIDTTAATQLGNALNKEFYKINSAFDNSNATNANSASVIISSILEETPLKQGCCKLSETQAKSGGLVTVRAPNIKGSTNPNNVKFDFSHQVLTIPPDTCPTGVYSQSDYCNAFYPVYCANVTAEFKKQNLSNADFLAYAPECACYAPRTASDTSMIKQNVPIQCVMTECTSPSAYMNKLTMAESPCNQTICTNVVNVSNLTVGGSATISPALQSACGPQLKAASTTSSKDNSSSSGSSSSGSSSSNSSSSDSSSSDSSSSGTWILIIFCIIIIIGIIIYFSSGSKTQSNNRNNKFSNNYKRHR